MQPTNVKPKIYVRAKVKNWCKLASGIEANRQETWSECSVL